ncbi:MAG: Nramp family divalent metal transporter [Saprospiraceae bacterium]
MAIGFTIGTGSVTSMIVAGSRFGMALLWVLVLSCFFSWVMMEAYGRFTLVTGQTALSAFRKNLKFGKAIAILIIIGVTIGQWNSLIGILGISSNVIFEVLGMFFPAIISNEYIAVLGIAILIISVFYYILLIGNFSLFEKVLVVFVTFMGLSFLLSMFINLPDSKEVLNGLRPKIPSVKGGKMMVAAFVGTTMAAATFLSRPLFLKGKGWDMKNLKDQKRDAIWAAVLIFIISGSIMAVATGALFKNGKEVEKVLDMVYALEPIAGKFAVAIFFLGTLSAGLSSIFPILMISSLLIADYQNGTLDTKSKQFRIIAGLACIVSLTVPITGANPVQIQVLSQVFNVFVLPLVIAGMMILINNKMLMGKHKAGLILNLGMLLALIFSLIISYNGVLGILENL